MKMFFVSLAILLWGNLELPTLFALFALFALSPDYPWTCNKIHWQHTEYVSFLYTIEPVCTLDIEDWMSETRSEIDSLAVPFAGFYLGWFLLSVVFSSLEKLQPVFFIRLPRATISPTCL